MNEYTVGEVARLSHTTVRSLHHYDRIGLLTPSGRSAAGYRLYSDVDLRRLQQVLFYREQEFGLDQIAQILADPENGADDHLRRQHRLVRERQARNQALLGAIEKEMEARQMGISLTPEEHFEIFGTDKMDQHGEEAEQRWSQTDAWKVSQRWPWTWPSPTASTSHAGSSNAGYDMHRGLAQPYVADPRYTAAYDAVAAGFSHYVHDAIVANADRRAG